MFVNLLRPRAGYSYSIFPRAEATGVLGELSLGVSSGAESSGLLATLGLSREESSSDTQSRVTGFTRYGTSDRPIEFGWLIDFNGETAPLQTSNMALVSIPSYFPEIEFHLNSGWLDRDADFLDVGPQFNRQTQIFLVPVPPDFEAIEAIIRDDDLERQPVIFNELLSEDERRTVLVPCRDAHIIIPGRRLWRSAEVSLGGLRANRIVVMPNMEGIVATFEKLPIELGLSEDIEKGLRLRVWTSEGVAESDWHFIVLEPPAGVTSCSATP